MNPIKLARKRKKNVSQKLADEFFNRHSKWRSSNSRDDTDASYATSRLEATQSSSFSTQTRPEGSTQQSQSTVTSLQSNQFQQHTSVPEQDFQRQNSIESSPPELKSSNLFNRSDSEPQQELGTFGLDEDPSAGQDQFEIKDRPILFDQLSNALEKSGSGIAPVSSDSLRSATSTENIDNQQATVPTNKQEVEIDHLSNRIGSLLQEAKILKADKELKKQQALENDIREETPSKELTETDISDTPSSQLDSTISDDLESKLSIEDQIKDKLSDIDLEEHEIPQSEQRVQYDPSQQDSTLESIPDSMSNEEEDSSSMSMLRAKINEVMNISGKLDQDNDEFFEFKTIENEFSKTKEPSPPTFPTEIDSKPSTDQIPIIKSRTKSKVPLNKEKLKNVLGLLKEEEDSSLKKELIPSVDELEPSPTFEEIKDVKIKVSRKFVLDPSNESLNIELHFENASDVDSKRNYVISHISPEGWKTDDTKVNYESDKTEDQKKIELMLKGPIIEWRLSAGKFE